jgi:uncharacterized membrane protein
MFPNVSSKVDRLISLTDAVYAIVFTLLVLDLKVPEIPGSTGNPELVADLVRQIPNFSAYIVSFVVISMFWLNHHRAFRSVKSCDEKALILNLLNILFVSLIPYTTSLIGHYEEDQIAVILFSANMGLAATSLVVLHLYISGKTEWHDGDRVQYWLPAKWGGLFFGPLLAIVSIVISFFSVRVSLAIWLLLPLRNQLLARGVVK